MKSPRLPADVNLSTEQYQILPFRFYSTISKNEKIGLFEFFMAENHFRQLNTIHLEKTLQWGTEQKYSAAQGKKQLNWSSEGRRVQVEYWAQNHLLELEKQSEKYTNILEQQAKATMERPTPILQ